MYVLVTLFLFFFFFKQKTAYEMRISDWSSDVCSSDLLHQERRVSHAWLLPALPAVALHAGFHLLAWRNAGGTDLHFFSALSLVGLGMALLTLLVGARGRMATLGVVVFPIAAATLGAYAGYGHRLAEGLDWRLQLHAWCAVPASAPPGGAPS